MRRQTLQRRNFLLFLCKYRLPIMHMCALRCHMRVRDAVRSEGDIKGTLPCGGLSLNKCCMEPTGSVWIGALSKTCASLGSCHIQVTQLTQNKTTPSITLSACLLAYPMLHPSQVSQLRAWQKKLDSLLNFQLEINILIFLPLEGYVASPKLLVLKFLKTKADKRKRFFTKIISSYRNTALSLHYHYTGDPRDQKSVARFQSCLL